jgi:2-keto-4-pentenoate hydratase/2-oxohepta-3-ene-1,7-dioic acid hydratase in catechol pathway
MKLVRFGEAGKERPGVLDKDGHVRDLSAHVKDISGEVLSDDALKRLAEIDPASLPRLPDGVRLGAPVVTPSKFVAIGLNYSDHAAEVGATPPTEPIIFLKAVTSICGPDDAVEKPRGSTKLDWEVELGIIIGKRAKYIEEAAAYSHIAGYCLGNDVSERNFQTERQGQWTKGKSHDTFGPLGPWLVTRDEIPNPQNLRMWLDVNGERQQNGTTATMIFTVPKIVSYVSHFMTLLPGDVIITGTPPGVGSGKKPPRFLNVGDVVTLGVDGLGTQRQHIVAA